MEGKYQQNHHNFKGNKFVHNENGSCTGFDSFGYSFIIDEEDYDDVCKFCWTRASGRASKNGRYFAARDSRRNNHKMMMLHNFIWEKYNGEIPNGYMVDHKDMNPANCRRDNLRLADKSLNSYNCVRDVRSNTSVVGVNGIAKDAKYHAGKWRAYINFNGKRKELGYFNSFYEAVIARLNAELKYYGVVCPSNASVYERFKEQLNG